MVVRIGTGGRESVPQAEVAAEAKVGIIKWTRERFGKGEREKKAQVSPDEHVGGTAGR